MLRGKPYAETPQTHQPLQRCSRRVRSCLRRCRPPRGVWHPCCLPASAGEQVARVACSPAAAWRQEFRCFHYSCQTLRRTGDGAAPALRELPDGPTKPGFAGKEQGAAGHAEEEEEEKEGCCRSRKLVLGDSTDSTPTVLLQLRWHRAYDSGAALQHLNREARLQETRCCECEHQRQGSLCYRRRHCHRHCRRRRRRRHRRLQGSCQVLGFEQ
mmetsp:Transcript_60679/g.121761  ORF Transcript_60679/g.121761 Transcript_60679/m.121761 type:complete len:213 (-) Transcript_60679:87-725(-)